MQSEQNTAGASPVIGDLPHLVQMAAATGRPIADCRETCERLAGGTSGLSVAQVAAIFTASYEAGNRIVEGVAAGVRAALGLPADFNRKDRRAWAHQQKVARRKGKRRPGKRTGPGVR